MENQQKKVAAMQTLSPSLPIPSAQTNEISVYTDNFNPVNAAKTVMKLNKAFPNLGSDFVSILSERVKELKISDQRLLDSVNYLIDNYHYPTMTIADIVSYDKKIKLLTYDEVMKIHDQTGNAFKIYKAVDMGQKTTLFANI